MDVIKAITGVNAWSKGDKRAPHKPLLLLYAIPQEAALGEEGFNSYINSIRAVCQARHIGLIYNSHSPIQIAVNMGFTDIADITHQYTEFLNCA